MPKAGRTHHLTIADTDGSPIYGLMYPPTENGKRTWSQRDSEVIRPRFMTMGELTHAELPETIQIPFFQEDWQAGIGGIQHKKHPLTLADSIKIDNSGVGANLRLQGDKITPTNDSAPSEFVPSGVSAHGDQLWAFQGRYPFRWDFANLRWNRGTIPTGFNIANSVMRNSVAFEGNHYVPRWADDAGSEDSFTGDDLPSIYWYKATADASWTASTLGNDATITDAFKYLAVADGSLWGGNTVTYADSGVNLGENLDTSDTDILTGTAPSSGQFTVGDITRIDAEYMLVTATGSSGVITVVRGYRGTEAVAHTSGANMYDVTHQPHHVHSTTDGTNTGTWSGATAIGDSSSPIVGLAGSDTDLIIAKTDGLYRLESDGTVTNLRPSLGTTIQTDQFRGLFEWNDRFLAPLSGGGMWELETLNFTIRDISFSNVMPNQTQYHGRVAALDGSATRLYALVVETANTRYHVLAAEWLSIDGVTDYRWSNVGAIDYTTNHDPDHSTIYYEAIEGDTGTVHDRIIVGVESTGSNLVPVFFPLTSNDVQFAFTNDTSSDDRGQAIADVTRYDGNLPSVSKRAQEITVETNNLGTTDAIDPQIEVQYRVDGGSYTYVTGSASTSTLTTSPQTLTFSPNVTGRIWEFRFLFERGSTATTSPELTNFTAKFQLRPDSVRLLLIQAYLADNQSLLNGARESRSNAVLAQLKSWNDGVNEVAVVFDDQPGDTTSYTAVFLPGSLRIDSLQRRPKARREYVVNFVLAEVG